MAPNTALVGLVLYFGWMIAANLLDAQKPEADLGRIASVQPEADSSTDRAQAAVQTFDIDRIAADRPGSVFD